MTVFKREFMKNFKALVIWTVSVTGLLALMLAQYKAMGTGIDASSYTEGFRNAMGMDKVDMNTFMGYYAVKASVLVTLFGGIYGALLGSGLVIKDESLLGRPVSRLRIVFERVLAGAAAIFLFNLAILVTVFFVEKDSRVFWIALGQFLLHMVFVAVGFLTASLKIRSKAPVMIPIGIVLATYVLTLVYGMAEKLEFLKYLSPFYYTDVKDIIAGGSLSDVNLAAVCLMIAVLVCAGGLVYVKRDMPA